MADKRFRGRDKIVQKMTKDGLVEENLRTGETKSAVAEEPPKQEDSEKDAAESAEETPVVEEDVCMDAEDGEEEKPRRSTAKQSTEYYKAHQEDGKTERKKMFRQWTRIQSLHRRKRAAYPLMMSSKVALSVARGWVLRKWRRKEWIPPLVFAHNKVHQVEKEKLRRGVGAQERRNAGRTVPLLQRPEKDQRKIRQS